MSPEFIVRPNPVLDEEFGTSVALGDGVAIVGAINDPPVPGAAYIFAVDAAGTTQRAKLTPSDSRAFASFGRAVGIDGNYALVGAPGAGAHGRGQAYIFAWDGASWSEQALLVASDGAPWVSSDPVPIHGDAAIVGGEWSGIRVPEGRLHLDRRRKLSESPASPAAAPSVIGVAARRLRHRRQSIGRHFAESRRCVRVSHRRNSGDNRGDAGARRSGCARPLRRGGRHRAPLPGRRAPGATSGGRAEVGAAYVFERVGLTWQQQRRLEPSNTHAVNDFGEAVTIRGDYLVVGDPAQHLPVAGTGAAYDYRRNGTNWTLIPPRIVPSDAGTDFTTRLRIRHTVAVSRFGVLVGAPGNTDTAREQGAAYVFPCRDPSSLSPFRSTSPCS